MVSAGEYDWLFKKGKVSIENGGKQVRKKDGNIEEKDINEKKMKGRGKKGEK